ncbi:MAG: hypothetical protein JO199_10605 [Candidatus Eremiobacteraeota bacterium]|nr:hypothetical protein [Candidatus Eremiobacteraeota bacterium]
MRTSTGIRLTSALLAAAFLAACSSGPSGANGSSMPQVTKFSWHGKLGKLALHVGVPGHRGAHHSAHDGKRSVHPHYLPSSIAQVAFTLVSVDGQSASGNTQWNFTLNTNDATECTAVSDPTTGGFSCTAVEPAPAAIDVWTIVATDSSSNVLSESNVSINVPAQALTNQSFTLNPIAAKLVWVVGTCSAYSSLSSNTCSTGFANGTGTPAWTGTKYTCSNSGGCYDPIVDNTGTPLADTATLDVLDGDGNVIVATSGGGGISGSPYVPIYYDSTGAEQAIQVSCSNGLEWLASTATPPIAHASLTSADLANGSYNGALAGPGNTTSGNPSLNSPVTAANGSGGYAVGSGTDFTGTAISDSTYGNNGTHVNYDGSLGTTVGLTKYSCTATLVGTGVSATYTAGLPEGQIGWGGN